MELYKNNMKHGAPDLPQIRALYQSAFPPDERAPFRVIRRRAKDGRGTMLVAKEHGKFIGFVYLIEHLDLVYLFYFAIAEDRRGRGFGGRILKALHKLYAGRRIFLAREQLDPAADNYDQRLRRHDFYLRSGFCDLDAQIREGNVTYDVMGCGGSLSAEEYDALITGWAGGLLRRLVDMRFIE